MEKKSTVPYFPAECRDSIEDILERIKFSNQNDVLLVGYSVSDTEAELIFKYPD
ncbi:MAG: hypothetical protein JRE64_12490 [Deltaproteobacteria bacterium]|nr:hypothetical protein [Deltaproteobacteria bacterium]